MHKKYIERAEEKLRAAKYLLKGRYYNDAVSRAYYSMFYAAKALLSTRDIYPKGHKGVVIKFGLEFVKKDFIESMYGRALSYAKDRREVADYDTEKQIHKEEAKSVVENAEKFLKRIKRAIKEVGC